MSSSKPLFTIHCTTCEAALKVRDASAIGQILACPKCGSMVQIEPPEGWSPDEAEAPEPEAPEAETTSDVDAAPEARPAPPEDDTQSEEPDEPGLRRRPTSDSGLGVWIWILGGVAALLVLAIGFVLLMPGGGSDKPIADGDDAVQSTDDEPTDGDMTPLTGDFRFLPLDAQYAFSASLDDAALFEAIVTNEELGLADFVERFRVSPRTTERITYATTDLASPDGHRMILVRLAEGQNAESYAVAGEATSITIDGVTGRRYAKGAWTAPFVVLDPRTILTGDETLLQRLADGERPARGPVARLLDDIPLAPRMALAIDIAAAREAGWMIPPLWSFVWPEAADAWREGLADVNALRLTLSLSAVETPSPEEVDADAEAETPSDEVAAEETPEDSPPKTAEPPAPSPPPAPYELEIVAACADEAVATAAAKSLNGSMATLLASAETQRVILESLIEDGRLEPANVDALNARLDAVNELLQDAAWAVDHDQAWLKREVDDASLSLLTDPTPSAVAARTLWLAAAESIDRERLARIAAALAAYRDENEQRFPKGVMGQGLLPPETRLSWLATLGPKLGLDDAAKLRAGANWDSEENKTIAKQPLEGVANPIVAPRASGGGYPMTDYVGVAGLGEDAAMLSGDDPRAGLFGYKRSIAIDKIPDGASNTMAVAPVRKQRGPWAAGGPSTVRPFVQRPYVNGPDGFGAGQPDGMPVLMADGSVRFLSSETAPEIIEGLATINGAEEIEDDWWGRPGGKAAAPPTEDTAEDDSASDADGMGDEETPAEVRPERPPIKRLTDDEVRERLKLPIAGVDFPNTPWRSAVDTLASLAGVPVTLDVDALRHGGVQLDAPVKKHWQAMSAQEVFTQLLGADALKLQVVDGQLLVTSIADLDATRPSEMYVIDDLATDEREARRLATVMQRLVEPTTWEANGGPSVCKPMGLSWEVQAAPSIHARVVAFLERLRVARKLPQKTSTALKRYTLQTPWEAAGEKLKSPITVNFRQGGSLQEILRDLERRSGVTLLPDWISLAKVNVAPTTEARVSAIRMPLHQTLVELLAPLDASVRVVGPTTFEVVSIDGATAKSEVAFFPIADLLSHGADREKLLTQFQTELHPTTWELGGGPGVLLFDEPSQTLLIRQSSPVLIDFGRLLEGVRGGLGAGAR